MATQSPEEELKRLLLSPELDLLATLDERLAALHGRVGDDAALEASTRRIIVDVLRDAGASDHERLSTILAPLMLSSLRAEIRGSRDMMVEALYPLTGRLVSAAVRNAFRELLQSIDSRVTETFSLAHLGVRLEALFSRRSAAELMLQRFPPFAIDEILVIHRPTGLLIASSGGEESVDRDLVGSMLNAVMSLTKDAFVEGDGGELSTLEFGDSQLFVKSSPTLILVVVTTGAPPKLFGGRLEELFMDVLERWGPRLADFDGELAPNDEIDLVGDLRVRMHSLVDEARHSSAGGSLRRPATVLVLLLLALLSWTGTASWRAYSSGRVEATARTVVDDLPGLAGYPIEVRYDRAVRALRVSGLTPDSATQNRLVAALESSVGAEVLFLLNTLPSATVAVERDPIAELQEFAQRHAIYFSEGRTPRAPDSAADVLDQIAALLMSTPDYVRVRVIGYVDPLGSPDVNQILALDRALFVRQGLEERGVPLERTTLVGRPGERLLTQEVGVDSDSRRAEFEVYFTEER